MKLQWDSGRHTAQELGRMLEFFHVRLVAYPMGGEEVRHSSEDFSPTGNEDYDLEHLSSKMVPGKDLGRDPAVLQKWPIPDDMMPEVYEAAITSQVWSIRGERLFLPMVDLCLPGRALPDGVTPCEADKESLWEILSGRLVVWSGNSFHLIGSPVPESKRESILGRILKWSIQNPGVVDLMWLAVGMQRGYHALRLTGNKKRLPEVVYVEPLRIDL